MDEDRLRLSCFGGTRRSDQELHKKERHRGAIALPNRAQPPGAPEDTGLQYQERD